MYLFVKIRVTIHVFRQMFEHVGDTNTLYDAECVNVYTRTGAGWTQLGGSRCGQLCACAVRSLGWREIGQQLAAGSPRGHNIAINTDTCRVTVRRYGDT